MSTPCLCPACGGRTELTATATSKPICSFCGLPLPREPGTSPAEETQIASPPPSGTYSKPRNAFLQTILWLHILTFGCLTLLNVIGVFTGGRVGPRILAGGFFALLTWILLKIAFRAPATLPRQPLSTFTPSTPPATFIPPERGSLFRALDEAKNSSFGRGVGELASSAHKTGVFSAISIAARSFLGLGALILAAVAVLCVVGAIYKGGDAGILWLPAALCSFFSYVLFMFSRVAKVMTPPRPPR